MNEWINEKLLPPVLKFVNTKAITALRNGMRLCRYLRSSVLPTHM